MVQVKGFTQNLAHERPSHNGPSHQHSVSQVTSLPVCPSSPELGWAQQLGEQGDFWAQPEGSSWASWVDART